MQAGINALMVLATAAPAVSKGEVALAADSDGGAGENHFAQLLNNSGSFASGEGAQQFPRGALPAFASNSALLAQDMAPPTAADLAALRVDGASLIDAQQATIAMAKIDLALAQTKDASQIAALAQLKDQLKMIEQGAEPKTIDQVIAAAPALAAADMPHAAVVALVAARRAEVTDAANQEEALTQTNQANANAMMQAMSAMMFRPARAEAASEPSIAEPKKEEVVVDVPAVAVVIDPLAFSTVVPVTPMAQAVVAASVTPDVSVVRSDLNEAIPSLALKPVEKLPTVELPQVTLPEQAAVQTQVAETATKASGKESPLGVPAKDAGGLDALDKITSGANDNQPFNPLLGASHVGAHSPTQTANAVPHVSVVAGHNYMNHAPVSEQVQVAIHQANKDGLERITIQLDPVDLGRVEVNMTRGQDGQTQITFLVDKPDTFDNLSRDARFLERSLQDAGIKADTGSMQFNLRQQPQSQLQSGLNGQGQQPQQQSLAVPTDGDDDSHSKIGGVQSMMMGTRHYTADIHEGIDISA